MFGFLFTSAIASTLSLLCLGMNGMLSAEPAILFHFQTVGIVLLVFHGVVVSLLALVAAKGDLYSHFGTSLIFASLHSPGYQKI